MTSGSLFADRLVQVWAEPGKVGTGVAIGTRGILTVRHVVKGGLNTVDGIQVRIVPTGAVEITPPEWVRAECVWTERVSKWDVALLEAHYDEYWVGPRTPSPFLVALDSRPEPDCHSVGFPAVDVQTGPDGKPLRQTKSVVGTLLPAAQARAPVMPNRPLPPRWLLLDIDTATPLAKEQWGGMSGAPVVLPDGRLAAIVVEASSQTCQLFVIALSDVFTHADGFSAEVDRLVGASTAVQHRDAARYRAALMIETLDASLQPRRVDDQESLAAFGVTRADTNEYDGFLPYVVRDDDRSSPSQDHAHVPGLREILRGAAKAEHASSRQVVLLRGSAGSGKSRSAAEAAIAELGARRLLRPIPGVGALQLIREWPAAELREAVVWLDDVETYAEPGLRETFRRLLPTGAVVVATIRNEQLTAFTDAGDLQNPAGAALTDHDLVMAIAWKKNWSDAERAEACRVVRTPAARQAIDAGKPLAVWAIAGPQLLDKWQSVQRDDDHPERAALVRMILDWYRTGHTRGIPRAVVNDLFATDRNGYTRSGCSVEEIEAAVQLLARPVFGPLRDRNALLVSDKGGDVLGIHDYIRDHDAFPPEIPQSMWDMAKKRASDEDVSDIAYAARRVHKLDIADDLYKPLSDAGITYAQFNLRVVRKLRARSFRNVLLGTSVALALFTILFGLVGALWPNEISLCAPTPQSAPTCPSGRVEPTGIDILVVEFIGVFGASLVGAVAVRQMRKTSTPCGVPIAALLVKLPTGALTAVLGVLLIRAGFLGAPVASSGTPQVLAYALIFGAAQQVFTRVVDTQAQNVLDSIWSAERNAANESQSGVA